MKGGLLGRNLGGVDGVGSLALIGGKWRVFEVVRICMCWCWEGVLRL